MNRASNAKAQAPGKPPGGPVPSRPLNPGRHYNRQFCRTSEYMPPGSKTVGLSATNQPSKVVWELDYGLTETKFKELSARFPGIAFVQTGFDCHDHPIAHTSYRIVWENVTKKLKPGMKVADVSGNPQFNEQFNSRQTKREKPIQIDTFCKVESTKDSIRSKTRWGPKVKDGVTRWEEASLYDMYRYAENQERFAQYDAFLFNHVIYYYTMEEINRLINLNKGSVAYATLHKLPGQNGSINCGEQTYVKDLQTGKVRQTNVETGEFYEHPNPETWFKQFSYADQHGAMAWTVNKGCDDTYVLTITSTDPRLVPEEDWLDGRIIFNSALGERVEVLRVVDADPPPAYAVEKVVIKASDIIPGYTSGKSVTVTITHPELYETLKTFMINKPRNVRTLQDLTAKAHREAGNNTLYGNNRRLGITSEDLTGHIFAAWRHGADLENTLFSSVFSMSGDVHSVNRNLSGRSLSLGPSNALKQAVRAALGVTHVMKSKDSFETVLRHVDELL